MKIQVCSLIFFKFRPENPFPEIPQSSCIVWDTQGPFLRHVFCFDFRPARQKPTKICRNGYLFPFPWRKQPRGPCPSQRAPDLKVHSQIESSVRPNGTPVMPLLHFGQIRRSSATCRIDLCYFLMQLGGNVGVICIVYLSPLPLLFFACLQNDICLSVPAFFFFCLTGFNNYSEGD